MPEHAVLACRSEQQQHVGRRRDPSVVEAVRGRERRPRHAERTRACVHRVHERPDAPGLLDREGLGGVVRGAEQETGQQVTDRDALTGPQSDRRAGTVVPSSEDRVRMDPDGAIELPLLFFEDQERGHQLRQARDGPRLVPRLLDEDLSGAEVDQQRRGGVDPRDGQRVGGGREAGDERGRRPVGRDRRGRRRGPRHDRDERRSTGGQEDGQEKERQEGGRDGGDPPLHALCRWSRRFVRSRACLNFRDVAERFARVCAAVRRASGFFWRSVGATIWSKNEDSRSAKCLYIVR